MVGRSQHQYSLEHFEFVVYGGDVRTIGDKHLLDGLEGIHERVSVGEDGSLVKQVIPFEIGTNVGPGECGICMGRKGYTRS